MKKLCFALCVFTSSVTALAAEKLTEFNVRPDLKGYQTTLKNGLTVVIVPNDRAPTTTVDHWVKAGSVHETPGITGMAHLFEHMMFRPLSPDQKPFFELSNELGAKVNAATHFQWTEYISTVPHKNLKQALVLESNRFRNLKVTDALLDAERKAVWSEYSTKFDANPVIDLWYTVYQKGFPGHSYGWQIIGMREDLEKINAVDCNAFFTKFYRPNNTGLFISGKLDKDEVLQWVEDLYGPWERGEDSKLPPPYKHDGKYVFARGRLPAESNSVLIGARTPEFDGKNQLTQVMADHILFDSPFSLSKRRLVNDKKIAADDGSFNFVYDSGMLKLYVSLLPTTSVEAAVEEVLKLPADLKALSDDEFKAYAKAYQIGQAETLLTNTQLVADLATSWGKFGDLNFASNVALENRAVRADIETFVSSVLTRDNLVVVTRKE